MVCFFFSSEGFWLPFILLVMGCQWCHFISPAEGACTSLSKVLVLSDHWVASGNIKCGMKIWGCICWVGRTQAGLMGETCSEGGLPLLHYTGTRSTIHNPRMALNFQNAGQGITLNLTKVLRMAELLCMIISLMPTGLHLWAL